VNEDQTVGRILITGASGFVGTNLASLLTRRGHELWALDRAPSIAAPPLVSPAFARRFSWERFDEIPWHELDAVVHLAGKAHDTQNSSDPQSYFTINVGLTERITQRLLAIEFARPVRFVLFSSVKAVADSVEGELTEATEPAPRTPYGQSKLAAEKIVLAAAAAHPRTLASYILRPCMIHGPGNKGNLNLLYNLARKGVPWPLGAFDNRRSFASIDNVCEVVESLLSGRPAPGIYQLADDEAISTNELITLIAGTLGRQPRIVKVPVRCVRLAARLGDLVGLPLNSERLRKLTESYVVANLQIKQTLGWQTMPLSTRDGLRRTLASFAAHDPQTRPPASQAPAA
jgi:nucleoside-diphosphate-sugar epimerase